MSRPTDPSESEVLAVPGRVDIDEHEHQALDLLDGYPRESSQDAISPGNAKRARTEAAGRVRAVSTGVKPVSGEVAAAVAVVRQLLPRVGTVVGLTLIDAASELARTEDRGSLEVEALDEIRLTLAEHPRLSLAIAPTVETLGTILGLDRDATAWAVLLELAEQAQDEADERLHACSTAIAERLAAAQPQPQPVPVPRALRVFRSAAVAQAGASIRARMLAADHPEQLGLALALVDHPADAAALVDAFDQARAALQAAAVERTAPDGAPPIDGPKRKFTYVHVILALIVLGLTVWHYVFR